MASGEHALQLHDTDRAPPWFESEHECETWPKVPVAPRVANLELVTDILENGDDATSHGD